MKKPDNIVYNHSTNEYDAYKKNYPTSFSVKNFSPEKIKNLRIEAQPYFKSKFLEIKDTYDKLLEKLRWNEIISNAKCNFNPITGKTYYLYEIKKQIFLSIIEPDEWTAKHLGSFRLTTDHTWEKIN